MGVADALETVLGISSNADRELGLEQQEGLLQMLVAYGIQVLSLGCRKFVRREVASTVVHEDKWAIVGNEMLCEKIICGGVTH